jgi:methylenetetrahydrofolate dehydrogenase (NADP+)/methenyltetrahydrofolate cyclohydrolase/formyltetrahydrofolate synthetase
MACLALANDLQDLKDRMGNMVIGSSNDKVPITADDLGFLKILILLFFYIYI